MEMRENNSTHLIRWLWRIQKYIKWLAYNNAQWIIIIIFKNYNYVPREQGIEIGVRYLPQYLTPCKQSDSYPGLNICLFLSNIKNNITSYLFLKLNYPYLSRAVV